jgi:hypothetical protein
VVKVSQELDARIASLAAGIEGEPFWRAVVGEGRSPALARLTLREVYLEIAWYQPDVIEATVATIGQMPRSLAPKTVQSMLLHQVEEWDHGEMAVRDYVRLGGSESFARTSRMSPSAFAVAAYWRMLAHRRDPFAYLGALFLFEGLTPLVSAKVREALAGTDYPAGATEYVDFHAIEDLKHQRLIRHLIDSVARTNPAAREAMLHGYDCFEHVYPLPAWRAAYQRALAGGSEPAVERVA